MVSMKLDIRCLIGKCHDAGSVPEVWPDALESLTDTLRVAGAADVICNKMGKCVDWVYYSGLSAEFQLHYVEHYVRLNQFTPPLNADLGSSRLTECLSVPLSWKSEPCNDFVLSCGVWDILGTRVVDTPSHLAMIGLHQRHNIDHLPGPERLDTESELAPEGAIYYFHVGNGKRYPDKTGKLFASDQAAAAYADVLAAELAQDGEWDGYMICVKDVNGRIITHVPVRK